MCSLAELHYALLTALPGERVRVADGELSKWSAEDGGVRFANYHTGMWEAKDSALPPTPMRVLDRA